MTTKNEISSRFIEAYNRLLSLGKTSDKKDFAGKIGVSPSMVTEISKGRSSVGLTAIQNIVLEFGVSADWILTGRGDVFSSESEKVVDMQKQAIGVQQPPSNTLDTFLTMIKDKDSLIMELSEEVGRLREQIRQLQKAKGHGALDASTSMPANAG